LAVALAAPAVFRAAAAVFVAVLFAVLFAPLTTLPVDADAVFLFEVFFGVEVFALDLVAVFFCAAGTCAPCCVVAGGAGAPCRGRPVRPPRMILATSRPEMDQFANVEAACRVASRSGRR
jgi:hypothetical protein